MEGHEQLGKELLELYRLMQKFWGLFCHRMNSHLVEGGLNGSQYMTMLALARLREATMGELSRDMHVTMGASTNTVDKLLKLGLASRARCEEDRRVVRVKLEAEGKLLLKKIEGAAVEYLADIFGEIPLDEFRAHLGSYRKIAARAMLNDASGVVA